MIVVKFGKDGQEYLLPGYSTEKDYAQEILSAMTGISRDELAVGDITDIQIIMLEDASKALQATPLFVSGVVPLKPKLKVVK